MKLKIAIITNIISNYREGFYDRLLSRSDIDVTIYCQKSIPGFDIKTIHYKYLKNINIVGSYTSKDAKIGFQLLPFFKIIKEYDVIFLDGNPRIVSNLIMSFLSFFSRKKFIMWTMAHSFGANKVTENLRIKWTSLHKNIFVYTDAEVDSLIKRGFVKHNIIGMNNGLDQKKIEEQKLSLDNTFLQEWQKLNGIYNKEISVSIARLIPKNKFEQVIAAIPKIIKIYPNFIWCLIGTGPEMAFYKELTGKYQITNHVKFIGALFEESQIAPYFMSAKIFIHPASIGLSLFHAYGYGLPVVIDDDKDLHGPEYGAFKDRKTGLNFSKDIVDDLADKVIELLSNKTLREEIKNYNLYLARNIYNVDVMVERFVRMAKFDKDIIKYS